MCRYWLYEKFAFPTSGRGMQETGQHGTIAESSTAACRREELYRTLASKQIPDSFITESLKHSAVSINIKIIASLVWLG
jgi:hypothetical protein